MPITTKEFEPRSWRDVLDKTLCDKVCQWIATGFLWVLRFSFTNKTGRHDITEILLKVALNTINLKKKCTDLLASAHCVLIVLISYVSSEVKTYNIGADSTLPSVPKTRKFENDTDEEDVEPKIPKTELTGKAILKKYFSLPKFFFFLEHQILPCRAQMFVQLCPRLTKI